LLSGSFNRSAARSYKVEALTTTKSQREAENEIGEQKLAQLDSLHRRCIIKWKFEASFDSIEIATQSQQSVNQASKQQRWRKSCEIAKHSCEINSSEQSICKAITSTN